MIPFAKASFPASFSSGLEYSVPARGSWNIAHVGMLIPEAHEVFVCAAGCLHGVVLSAAEMNLTRRFSTIAVEEHNVLDGDLEELIISGVTDILNRLPYRPKALLLYSSCIDHFVGCDLDLCFKELRARFPEVAFTDCYMTPILRKSGMTPDQKMRRQLYSLLEPKEKKEKHCAILGNCVSLSKDCDLIKFLENAGWTVHQLPDCETYEQYLEMACCTLCITTQAVANPGAEALCQRLSMNHLYLPFGVSNENIDANMNRLAVALGTTYTPKPSVMAEAEAALQNAKEVIGATPIAIDYNLTTKPLELAKLLLEHGFRVTKLFADSFSGEEQDAFCWLQENAPDLELHPTVHTSMRFYRQASAPKEKTLALGQKAAFFTNTPYFVNLVENGELYGYWGVAQIAQRMIEAFSTPKDTETLISRKALGCESLI